ncbi:hypothetical protein BC940DRAFT_297018 [Gongronella butleri]|nr:hypothetical protein BC940DRAFT_297018 [Gongronella butleri]
MHTCQSFTQSRDSAPLVSAIASRLGMHPGVKCVTHVSQIWKKSCFCKNTHRPTRQRCQTLMKKARNRSRCSFERFLVSLGASFGVQDLFES